MKLKISFAVIVAALFLIHDAHAYGRGGRGKHRSKPCCVNDQRATCEWGCCVDGSDEKCCTEDEANNKDSGLDNMVAGDVCLVSGVWYRRCEWGCCDDNHSNEVCCTEEEFAEKQTDESENDDKDDDDDDHVHHGGKKALVICLGVFATVMFILAATCCVFGIHKHMTANQRQTSPRVINVVSSVPNQKSQVDRVSAYPKQAHTKRRFEPEYLDVEALQAPPRYEQITTYVPRDQTQEVPNTLDMPPPYDRHPLPPISTADARYTSTRFTEI